MSIQPKLGIGLDLAYASRQPFPGGAVGLFTKYRARLSHLQLLAVPDDATALEWRARAGALPIVHHMTSIDPTAAAGPNFDKFREQDRHTGLTRAKWQYEDLGSWYIGPYNAPFFAPPVLDIETAAHTAANLRQLNEIATAAFIPENPPCAFTIGALGLGEFFREVVERAETPMVLDVSHLYAYARAWDRDPRQVLRTFPLEAVWELHVAGGIMHPKAPRRYLDTHVHPIHQDVADLLPEVVELCPNLRACTYETSGLLAQSMFEAEFERLEGIMAKTTFVPAIAA